MANIFGQVPQQFPDIAGTMMQARQLQQQNRQFGQQQIAQGLQGMADMQAKQESAKKAEEEAKKKIMEDMAARQEQREKITYESIGALLSTAKDKSAYDIILNHAKSLQGNFKSETYAPLYGVMTEKPFSKDADWRAGINPVTDQEEYINLNDQKSSGIRVAQQSPTTVVNVDNSVKKNMEEVKLDFLSKGYNAVDANEAKAVGLNPDKGKKINASDGTLYLFQALSDKQKENVTSLETVKGQLIDNLQALKDKDIKPDPMTGLPIVGGLIRKFFKSPDFQALGAQVDYMANKYRHDITGAQAGWVEIQNIMNTLATTQDLNADVFEAKTSQLVSLFDDMNNRAISNYEEQGLDVSKLNNLRKSTKPKNGKILVERNGQKGYVTKPLPTDKVIQE